MFVVLLFVLLLAGSALGGEKIITLQREPLEITHRSFFIKEVIDARSNRDDVGFAQVGLFNRVVAVRFKSEVRQELLDYFAAALPQSDGQTPIILKLLALRVGEHTKAFSERAFAGAAMAFYVQSDSALGKVGEAEAVYESPGMMDVTGSHEKNLRIVIGRCLQQFADSDWEKVTPVYEAPITETADSVWSHVSQRENEAPLAHGPEDFNCSLGLGGFGGQQQQKVPFEFGSGWRVFFGTKGEYGLNIEIGFEYAFARPMSDGAVFVFGNESKAFGFSQARQLNLDFAFRIPFSKRPWAYPYLLANFGGTSFHGTDAKAIQAATLKVEEARASISGIYFGAGLGYRNHLSRRVFIDFCGIVDRVLITGASGDGKSGRLPKSIGSSAQMMRVQLGYDFNL